jgi:hypothetical protein
MKPCKKCGKKKLFLGIVPYNPIKSKHKPIQNQRGGGDLILSSTELTHCTEDIITMIGFTPEDIADGRVIGIRQSKDIVHCYLTDTLLTWFSEQIGRAHV